MLAVALSPRIPLPVSIPGRRLDLRLQDVLLAFLTAIWLGRLLFRPRLVSAGLLGPFALYLGLSAASTIAGGVYRDLPFIRGGFYLLKDVEYLALCLLVMQAVRKVGDLYFVTRLALMGGVLNVLWVLLQLTEASRHPLIIFGSPEGVYDPPRLLEAYGPGIIGEVSPLAVGGYFLLMFLLALGFVQVRRSMRAAVAFAVLALAFCAGLLLSQSRVMLAGLAVAFVIPLLVHRRRHLSHLLIVSVVPAALGMAAVWGSPLLEDLRFLQWGGYGRSLAYRWDVIWAPLVARIPDGGLLGFGKGSLGAMPGMVFEEAHNYYLRVTLESGILGLAAFLWILRRVVALSSQVYTQSSLAVGRAVGFAALVGALTFALAGMVQDVFAPVLPNTLWWMLVGLAGAARHIEGKGSREHP